MQETQFVHQSSIQFQSAVFYSFITSGNVSLHFAEPSLNLNLMPPEGEHCWDGKVVSTSELGEKHNDMRLEDVKTYCSCQWTGNVQLISIAETVQYNV